MTKSRLALCSTLPLVISAAGLIAFSTRSRSSAPTSGPKLDWPNHGNDLANTRFQNVDQINPSNVANLTPAWIFHTGVLDPRRH